jgi:hypothetical protein
MAGETAMQGPGVGHATAIRAMLRMPVFCRFLLLTGCYLASAPAPALDHDGDINVDGAVDVADLLWAYQAMTNIRSLGPVETLHADVAPLADGIPVPDGEFNTADVAVLLRMLLHGIDFSFPGNQFNIGDSIGEGEAADDSIGEDHHESVWSTGYDGGDVVTTVNERFEGFAPEDHYENNASRDALFNLAVSGAVMADFEAQAQAVIAAAALMSSGEAGLVTVLLGNNDVCAPSLGEMTDPELFEAQFRAGLGRGGSPGCARAAGACCGCRPNWDWVPGGRKAASRRMPG